MKALLLLAQRFPVMRIESQCVSRCLRGGFACRAGSIEDASRFDFLSLLCDVQGLIPFLSDAKSMFKYSTEDISTV